VLCVAVRQRHLRISLHIYGHEPIQHVPKHGVVRIDDVLDRLKARDLKMPIHVRARSRDGVLRDHL